MKNFPGQQKGYSECLHCDICTTAATQLQKGTRAYKQQQQKEQNKTTKQTHKQKNIC